MRENLCLKWNNHSSEFLKSISSIHSKEKFCDATIVCQGKYYPVHRIVLTTCSDYFDEIFDRIQCQHPYIIFKDIDPRDIELLLNYMYEGEVNVIQELLPAFIKAAESLKIKGLTAESLNSKVLELPNDVDGSSTKAESEKGSECSNNTPGNKRLNSVNQSSGNEILDIKEEPIDSIHYGAAMLQEEYSSNFPLDGALQKNEFEGFSHGLGLIEDSLEFLRAEPTISIDHSMESQISNMEEDSAVDGTKDNLSDSEGTENDISTKKEYHQLSAVAGYQTCLKKEFTVYQPISSKTSHSYQCHYCSYKSYSSAHLKSHIRFKHNLERPFPCSFCTKRFTKKIGLEQHILIHTGERPFACLNCNKSFRQKIHLRTHIANKHPNYPC